MAVCAAVKRDGSPCTLQATGKNGLCWAHDPRNAEQRRQRAAKGGRGRQGSELRDLKSKIEEVIEGVLDGSIERSRGAIAFQGLNTLVRAIELERRVREQEEVLQRLESLERRQDFGHGTKGGRRVW